MAKATLLEKAQAAAKKNRWSEVLEALLGLWETKRPASLGELIEAISAHLNPKPTPIVSSEWNSLADDRSKDSLPSLGGSAK
jgi:hypothetical protein